MLGYTHYCRCLQKIMGTFTSPSGGQASTSSGNKPGQKGKGKHGKQQKQGKKGKGKGQGQQQQASSSASAAPTGPSQPTAEQTKSARQMFVGSLKRLVERLRDHAATLAADLPSASMSQDVFRSLEQLGGRLGDLLGLLKGGLDAQDIITALMT